MSGTGTPVFHYQDSKEDHKVAIWPTRKQNSGLMTWDVAYESSSHSGAYKKKIAAKDFNWLTKLKEMTLKFP